MVNCINLIIEMSPRFILGRENVPCVAEVVNRSLKADCTDYTAIQHPSSQSTLPLSIGRLSKLTRRLRGGGQQANFYSEGLMYGGP